MKSILMYAGLLLLALGSLSAVPSPSANYFVIEGMQVEWTYEGDLLTFKLHSPYQGWVGLGFNTNNDIVNSNLVMGAVEETSTNMEEFFVVGFGNPQPVKMLGGQVAVKNYQGVEDAKGTSFQFSIDTSIKDDFHYDLTEGQKVWWICFYRMEDDFGHHSIMRRHLEISL